VRKMVSRLRGIQYQAPSYCGHVDYPGVDERIILKWILKKWDGETWTGLIWLKIRTGGGLLLMM